MTEPSPTDQLRELYALIPEVNCKRKCQAFCSAVFDEGSMSLLEQNRVLNFHGYKPPGPAFECGYLDEAGRCSVYATRPTICRLWGVVEDAPAMRCSFGCEPDRWLTNAEAMAIMHEAVRIGGGQAPPTTNRSTPEMRKDAMIELIVREAAKAPGSLDGSRGSSAVRDLGRRK